MREICTSGARREGAPNGPPLLYREASLSELESPRETYTGQPVSSREIIRTRNV